MFYITLPYDQNVIHFGKFWFEKNIFFSVPEQSTQSDFPPHFFEMWVLGPNNTKKIKILCYYQKMTNGIFTKIENSKK